MHKSIRIFSVFGILMLIHSCSGNGQLSSSPTASPTLSSLTTPKSKTGQKPTDDKGRPFPTKSGYLKGYPALSRGGYSSVTVDNSQNNSDVFVKLFSLNTTPPKAVRVFFIRANNKFTVKDIKAGSYDVRYRNLDSKGLAKTEQFDLKEIKDGRKIKFSGITLTLYKVIDGNMQTQPISENEF